MNRIAAAVPTALVGSTRGAMAVLGLRLVGLAVAVALPAQEPIQPVPGAGKQPADPAARAQGATHPATPPSGGLGALELAQAITATMRLSTPGPEHERLAALAGSYSVDMTLQPPGLDRQQCTGRARAASVLGGRYLIVNLAVRVQATPLEGIYILGFDNLHGLYTASWRDSLSTWSVECSGPAPAGPQEPIVLGGTLVDAASPTGRPFHMQLAMLLDGFEVVVHDSVASADVEVMRQRFTRTADAGKDNSAEPAAAPAPPKAPPPPSGGK